MTNRSSIYESLFFLIFCLLIGLFAVQACSEQPDPGRDGQVQQEPPQSDTQSTDAGRADVSAPDSRARDRKAADTGAADGATKEEKAEATPEPAPQTKPFPPITGNPVLKDENPDPKIVEVKLRAYKTRVQLSSKIAQIMYTYNGIIPGPIIRARVGDKVIIHFKNDLPEPTTVHWHGLRIPDKMDGTPRVQKPVAPGESFTYSFVVKDAGSFWYHPHIRSNEQVEKGLYGMLIVQEKDNISFDIERSIVLDDILLTDGRLAKFMAYHGEIMHGRNGNFLFANGKLDPKTITAKTGTVERWRIVNVANARTITLQFKGLNIRVIGSDGGLIPKPYKINQYLTVTVGQRFDLEVTFDKPGDFALEMVSPARGGGVNAYPMQKVRVVGDATTKPTAPPNYPKIEPLPNKEPDRSVEILFDGVQDPSMPTGVAWRLNKKSRWTAPMFTFKQGETIDFTLKNLNAQPHPFHLHGQFFTILTRDGKPASEPGLKDSVLLQGNETLVIRGYMDNPGQWMAHCHILEHAELGMMAEIVVTPTP